MSDIRRSHPAPPVTLLLIIAAAIFISESLSMAVIFELRPFLSGWTEALIDSTLLLVFLSPILYFFAFRPMLRQIKELKNAEDSLAEREEKYRSLVESTEDSIYVLDRDYRYLFINKNHLSRLGIGDNQYLGRSYGDYHSESVTRDFTKIVDNVFATGESIRYEHNSERDNKVFLMSVSPIREHDGSIIAVTVVSKNISDLKRLENELRELTLTDDLTGLYNRRAFMTLAEQHMKIAARQKSTLYMLYADLDNMKEINDTHGHSAGDSALKEIAGIFKETFRDSDIIARVGGDEFVVFPVGITHADAEKITARLEQNLAARNAGNNHEYLLSVSFGLSHCDPERSCSIDEMLVQADKSMYGHKKSRKNDT